MIDDVLKKFDDYFTPRMNTFFEGFKFRNRSQPEEKKLINLSRSSRE